MKAPLLSIVIPVYNVSDYVEKCIRSCYNQNISSNEYEVIIVNDGSKDDSLNICENLQKEFTDFKIISQPNKGLSGARNTGLKHASGTYVWFVDSDDWIEKDCLQQIFEHLNNNKSDILWLGHDVIHQGKTINSFIPIEEPLLVTGEELFLNHLNNLFYIWKFIYKRAFLNDNGLEFFEGVLYEDLEFTPRALLKAKSCLMIPDVFYHYLMRSGSIINNISQKNVNDRFFILNRLNTLSHDDSISVLFRTKIKSIIIFFAIGTVKMSARSKKTLPDSCYALFKSMKKVKNLGLNTNLNFSLLKFNTKLYYSIYKSFYGLYNHSKSN